MDDLEHLNEPDRLAQIAGASQALGFTMASAPLTGSLLRTLVAAKPGARCLELGCGTGLATAWLLDGMDERSTLLALDNDEALLDVVRRHLGNDPRLDVVCADGDEFLRTSTDRRFDLVFADTWSGKYRLLDEALALLDPGGVYVVDDMTPQTGWPTGHADKVTALTAHLEHLDGFRVTKLSWASGIILAAKR